GEAGRQIQDFLWSEFADWYVEVAKVQLEDDQQRQHLTREVLFTVLEGSLRLLHPFMPFVTEEAWQYLTAGGREGAEASIMVAPYPTHDPAVLDDEAERDFGLIREVVTGIRNIRTEYKVEPSRWVGATLAGAERTPLIEAQRALVGRLARVADSQL